MSSEILEILKGIDQTQTESEEGWWETSEGARFGAQKLDVVISRFKKLKTQRNELLEVLIRLERVSTELVLSAHNYNEAVIAVKTLNTETINAGKAIAKAKGE